MLLAAGTFASDLKAWSRRIRAVAHTVLLIAERPERDRSAWSQILGWIRDLARVSRCTGLVLGGSTNSAGIGAALTWNAGAPSGIDLRLGHPRHLPGSIERGAARGEFDLILRVAGRASGVDDLDFGNSSMGRIEIGPHAGTRVVPGDGIVQIECAEFGVDEGGTIARMDAVLMPVRPWQDADRPRVAELLRNWVDRFDEDFSV
jgi:formylmethanofuran dehydrogenase subunit B